VPPELVETQVKYHGDEGRVWCAGLPALAAAFLDRWDLRLDGEPRHGVVALVLPVTRSDGTPAVLKLQQIDPEHIGESTALAIWAGRGAVRLLDDDPDTGTMLLERLHYRCLDDVADDLAATQVIAELLARLTAHPGPPGINRLGDIAGRMLADAPAAVEQLTDPDKRRIVERWAAVVAEVAAEPGDRLLHWDLHFQNVLASDREPWLAIDPKPLSGDPGFELLPALHNRWDDIVATGDVPRAVRRRFDLMTEVLGLDRRRAVAWTLGRLLQDALWDIEDGRPAVPDDHRAISEALQT